MIFLLSNNLPFFFLMNLLFNNMSESNEKPKVTLSLCFWKTHTTQNSRIFSLLSFVTNKSIRSSHLRSRSQRCFAESNKKVTDLFCRSITQMIASALIYNIFIDLQNFFGNPLCSPHPQHQTDVSDLSKTFLGSMWSMCVSVLKTAVKSIDCWACTTAVKWITCNWVWKESIVTRCWWSWLISSSLWHRPSCST